MPLFYWIIDLFEGWVPFIQLGLES